MKFRYPFLALFLIVSVSLAQFQPQTRTELDTAVAMWISDSSTALTTYGEINTWDVSLITDMYQLFAGEWNDHSPFNDDISNWDVSNVTNMRRMFYFATDFNQDISSLSLIHI